MIGIDTLLALLDKIPIWKNLTELPKRVSILEDKIKQMESKPNGKRCIKCEQNTIFLDPTVVGHMPSPRDLAFVPRGLIMPFRLWKCSNKECNHSIKEDMDRHAKKFNDNFCG